MQRVKSDDLNGDEEDNIRDEKKEICSPIGAGLPLLHRLRLLKEKQVRICFLNLINFFKYNPLLLFAIRHLII